MGTNRRFTHWSHSFKPAHETTKKMTYRPSEDSDQTGQLTSVSEYSLSAWRNWVLGKDWSDWADTQADLSLRWVRRSFYWFCRAMAHLLYFVLSHLRQRYWFLLFRVIYSLKLPEKAMVFIYPCTGMLVSSNYVTLQTSSSTHPRRSMRDEWTPQCSYSLLVVPWGGVRVVSLMVNGYADSYKLNRRNHLRHK